MIAFRRTGVALTVSTAAFFIAAPLYSFFVNGPFGWHIRQPAAWQGGAEILALTAVFYFAHALRDVRVRLGVIALAAWLFARRHGVDLSIALIYLYAEGIFAIGWSLLPRIGVHQSSRPSTVLVAALAGVVAWSLVVWISSLLGMGSLSAIRFIAIAVLGLAITLSRGPRIASIVVRTMHAKRRMDRLALAAFAAFFLALFAKASVVVDYDSMWYGLQADKVLVGEGSLYAAQGLVSFVHYYPKLYEALQLPFAGLGSVSLVYGVSIFSWMLVVVTAQTILREFHVRRTLRLWGTAAAASLPALANSAVSAKGDVFSAWLLLMGVIGLIRYRKRLGGVWIWIAVSGAVLSVQARLATIPYAAILIVAIGYSVVARWRAEGDAAVLNKGIWLGASTALLSALVAARSILLAGVVFVAPFSLVELQQKFGMHFKYPLGLPPSDVGLQRLPILDGLWGILFNPAQYPHLIITWTGNVWLFVPIAVALFGLTHTGAKPSRGSWLLLLLGLMFFALMFGLKTGFPGSDGNYFIVPLTCLTMWGVVMANRIHANRRTLLNVLLILFAICGAAVSFVTGSWGPGTRGFDHVMTRLPFEFTARATQELAAAHLRGVARYFNGTSPGTRVVGLETVDTDAGLPVGWWLPLRYEPLLPFAWQQPELVATAEAFQQYLHAVNITYVVTPQQNRAGASETRKHQSAGVIDTLVRTSLEEMHAAQRVEVAYVDDYWTVWKLHNDPVSRIALSGGGTAAVEFDNKLLCERRGDTIATVSWTGAASNVAIEVGTDGKAALWVEGGTSGSLQTGPWVPVDAEFTFTNGRRGPVIGRITVTPRCDP